MSLRIFGFNKKLVCTPFEDMSVKKELAGTGAVKVAFIQQKAKLAALTVLASTPDLPFVSPGDRILVKADLFAMPWAKETYELDGVPYILVPSDRIEAVLPGER